MTRIFDEFMADETGASAAEYAHILAVVGSAIARAAITLGDAISTSISETAACISSDGATC